MANPELTQSLMADVLRSCGNDQEKYKGVIGVIGQQVEVEKTRERERKTRELEENFPSVPKEIVARVLEQNDWDVDRSILPLFQLLEQQREEERRRQESEQVRKREQEGQRRKEEARRQANAFLKQLFSTLPEAEIQRILEENEGDLEATTDQLLSIVRKAEVEREERHRRQHEEEKKERQLRVDVLARKFFENITEKEVAAALEKNSWDVRAASTELLRLSEQRKKEHLKKLYKPLTEEEIKRALETNQWNMAEATRECMELREKKLREAEAAAVVAAPPARPVVPAAVEEENFLMRSTIVGRAVVAELKTEQTAAADTEKQLTKELFLEELEQKIRFSPENVPGMPGVPLTRKTIDRLQQELPAGPVPESPSPAPAAAVVILPAPATEAGAPSVAPAAAATLGSAISLEATPDVVDIGDKFTVNWQVAASSTEPDATSNDWIALYETGKFGKDYLTYQWVSLSAGPRAGSLSFAAPAVYGDYYLCYYSGKQYNLKATSATIKVGPRFVLSASGVADGGKKVEVRITQATGKPCPNAWLGCYPINQTNPKAYVGFQWLAGATKVEGEALPTFSVQFDLPKAGQWEFRLFPQRAYVDVARCSYVLQGEDHLELAVEGAVVAVKCKLSTVDPNADAAWVGLYRVEENDNRQWRRYKHVPDQNAAVTFKTPRTPGTYEARLFANRTYDILAKSTNTITITGPSATTGPIPVAQ